ncbi:MAG: hypothetical protein M0R06_26335 [Sphaerochaeta sp.]|nr:hypothetical protein [Sphaerochaeta sp.]
MAELYIRRDSVNTAEPVSPDNPLPVELHGLLLPPVAGRTITRLVKVPGITADAAHADGDALGTMITFPDVFRAERCSGVIVGAFILDLDNEGLQVDLPIFTRAFTATADDSAFTPSDTDMLACRAVLEIYTFSNWGANQFGRWVDNPIWINGESVNLYTQVVARGAINIAAGADPYVGIVVVPD